VIATWLRRELESGERGRWLRTAGIGEDTVVLRRTHDHLKIVGDVLCLACNRGWSARLEERAKPLLLPMMRITSPAVLDADAQTVLATWLSKTGHLLSYVNGYATEAAVASAMRSSRDEHQPDERTAVWLARFDRNPLLRHAWWRKELIAAGKLVAELYVLTFDTLAGVVLIREASAPEDWGLAERKDWFVRVWPSVDSVTWPPQRPVTLEQLHRLTGARSATPQV
jgi:hypothetical protein